MGGNRIRPFYKFRIHFLYIFVRGEIELLERNFQSRLIREIKERFPGCVVLKNDEQYIQGFPDLTVLHGKKWAVLETKREKNASRRPNQKYYVDKLNAMSYSRFVCPENKEEVMNELSEALKP